MSSLQQDLRKIVQKLKGKPCPPLVFSELNVLSPINPQNTPFYKNQSAKSSDQKIGLNFIENMVQKRQPVQPIRVPNEKSLKMPSFRKIEKNEKIEKMQKMQINEKMEKLQKNEKIEKLQKNEKMRKFENIQNIQNFEKNEKIFKETRVNQEMALFNRRFEENYYDNFPECQNPLFYEDDGPEEATKKSPILEDTFGNQRNPYFQEEYEQNTVIKVKLEGCEGIPEVNLSKEQDDIIEKINEQSKGHFMSFKQFTDFSNQKNDETQLKEVDIFEKTQKLSFREEDYFDKSVRLDKRSPSRENEDKEEDFRAGFELLNEKKLFRTSFHDKENIPYQEDNNNETPEMNLNEDLIKYEDSYKYNEEAINPQENQIPENSFNNEINQNLATFKPTEKPLLSNNEFIANTTTTNINSTINETSINNFEKLMGSFVSNKFSRPYDLKPDERDQYIDEIYLKFRFEWKEENLNKNNPVLKEEYLNVRFEKGVVEKMRDLLGLDDISPEIIVDEVFNLQNLSRISKTFFKIKMQVNTQFSNPF